MKLLKFITKHNLHYYLLCLLVVLACFDRRQVIIEENNVSNFTVSENASEILELVMDDIESELTEYDLPSLLSSCISEEPVPITIDLLLEKNEGLQEDIGEFNEQRSINCNKALATGTEFAFKPYDKPNVIEMAMEDAKTELIENYKKELKIENINYGNYNVKENGIGEYNGAVLTNRNGRIQGPSGQETWYNLDMSKVVQSMRNRGYDYEYWVRADGVKMFGEYVMVAANLEIRPKGTILPTSLGMGIVCDTGGFAKKNPTQLDIAVAWVK
jgi:hypothetical protein